MNKPVESEKPKEKFEQEISKFMGPLPNEAKATLNADTEKPEFPQSEYPRETEDPVLDRAVKDISRNDSDELLAAEDKVKEKPQIKKHHNFIKRWWNNHLARNISLTLIVAIFSTAALIPVSRYYLLNLFGITASTSFKIIDIKSGRAIKNVEVEIGETKGLSDNKGQVSLSGVKLGKSTVILKKRSFATLEQPVVIGWGSNPFDSPFQMTPVGTRYKFIVSDWLSGLAIKGAEVSDGESVSLTDEKGIATLTIEPTDEAITMTLKAGGYRQETYKVEATDKSDKPVSMVPAKPAIFVSNRSGRYDLYKKDVDDKNEVILLPGTGSEQSSISLLVHPIADVAAFVSTREGKRNSDGYLLSNLYIIDIASKSASKVNETESESIRLIGWQGDLLIYEKIVAGPSGNVSNRQRLLSYDYKKDKSQELASVNYFNVIKAINGEIYYAPSSYGVGEPLSKLFKVSVDGSGKTSLINSETWSLYRSSYGKLLANAANNYWYEISLTDAKVTKLAGTPASPTNRTYVDSPNGLNSLWVDNRDGKGVLILEDLKTHSEKIIASSSGLTNPVRWLTSKHLLYRVANTTETADYVLNIDGGSPKKVTDVMMTYGYPWYY